MISAMLALREEEGFQHIGPRLFIQGDDPQQVLNRDHAAIGFRGIHHGQVEDAVLFHQAHALIQWR